MIHTWYLLLLNNTYSYILSMDYTYLLLAFIGVSIPDTCCHWMIHTCFLLSLNYPACCHSMISICYLMSLNDTYMLPAVIGLKIIATCSNWMKQTCYLLSLGDTQLLKQDKPNLNFIFRNNLLKTISPSVYFQEGLRLYSFENVK